MASGALLFPVVGGVALGFMAFAFAAGFTVFEWRESVKDNTLSATDLVAALVTFSLGIFAVLGNKAAAAAAAGVTVTGLLALRHPLHTFLRTLTWPELRSALLLLAMTFVLLPILPDRTIDPWDSLNPHKLWLITVAIAALSFVGYVAVRLAGARRGLLLAGAAGGLVSSTAVTLTYARLAKSEPEIALEAGVAICRLVDRVAGADDGTCNRACARLVVAAPARRICAAASVLPAQCSVWIAPHATRPPNPSSNFPIRSNSAWRCKLRRAAGRR